MMNPPEIINKNYTPEQEGKEIRQEDVVRPMNRKITIMLRRLLNGKRSADLVHQPMGAANIVSGVDPLVNVAINATMENMKPSYS
jgi:hypothetical protein